MLITSENLSKPLSSEEAQVQLKRQHQRAIEKQLDNYYQTLSCSIIQKIFMKLGEPELARDKLAISVTISLLELLLYEYQNKKSYTSYEARIPMSLRCSKLSKVSCEEYDQSSYLKQWIATVNREVTDYLEELGLIQQSPEICNFQNPGYGIARLYNAKVLSHEFVKTIEEKAQQQQLKLNEYQLVNDGNSTTTFKECNKPAPLGAWNKNSKTIPRVTKQTIEKLRNSTFCFDQKFYEQFGHWAIYEYATLNRGEKDLDSCYECMMSIVFNLNAICTNSNLPQFHPTWELQDSARLHTRGGIIGLPKPLRWLFIRPTDSNNVLLELDLKSAQLIVLCQELRCYKLLSQIQKIIARGESVWDYIRPKDLKIPKRALKNLTYALCFGANLRNLKGFCNEELNKAGVDFRLNQKQINRILKGFLSPLVSAREKWLEQYQLNHLKNLKKRKKASKLENKLGFTFNLIKEMDKYLEECQRKKCKPEQNKIAKRALAHIAQGAEQNVMHNLIASPVITDNINAFQFDGLTLEVPRHRVEQKKKEIDYWLNKNFPEFKMDYEVIDHQNDPEFDHHQNHINGTNVIQELSKR